MDPINFDNRKDLMDKFIAHLSWRLATATKIEPFKSAH
jgi:hypothetical protein